MFSKVPSIITNFSPRFFLVSDGSYEYLNLPLSLPYLSIFVTLTNPLSLLSFFEENDLILYSFLFTKKKHNNFLNFNSLV